jgi:cytochrome P450
MKEEDVTIDYDHTGSMFASNSYEINQNLARKCPIAWTSAHGGFWVASGHETVKQASSNPRAFSSRHDLPDGSTPFRGADVPGNNVDMSFLELDPPAHTAWRRAFNPRFTPHAVDDKWKARAQDLAAWCVDRVIERGEMEVIEDLAGPVPAIITLEMLGLPLTEWKTFSFAAHAQIACVPGTDEYLRAQRTFMALFESIPAIAAERRAHPTDDLLSLLATMKVDDEPLSDEQIVSAAILIIGGGVDTTTNLTAHTVAHLASHPDDRRRIVEDRSLLKNAREEFARYFSPVTSTGRTTTETAELNGVTLGKHERVLLSWSSANNDPTWWVDPEVVRIDRYPNRHFAFGLGVHRCIGSHLARTMFTAMIDALLTRIPDFEVVGEIERYETVGSVNGVRRLNIVFEPRPALSLTMPELE